MEQSGRASRPKESAAHRRERVRRSTDRVLARLAAAHNRLSTHHGSQPPAHFHGSLVQSPASSSSDSFDSRLKLIETSISRIATMLEQLMSAHRQEAAQSTPSSSPGIPGQILDKLDSLERQLHIVIGRLNSFDSYSAPAHASASQQQQRFDLSDLLDTAAIQRVDRALDETASQPEPVSSGIWWSCPFPGCGYSLQSGDRLRSQKKAQHRRKHEHANTGVIDPAQTTSSPAETKPATKIVGKTKLADVKFVPLAGTIHVEPGEEASASSAPANSCLLATDVAPLEGKHITFAQAASARTQPSHRVRGKTPSADIDFKGTDDVCTIVVRFQGRDIPFQLKPSIRLGKIFTRLEKISGIPEAQLIIMSGSRVVQPEDTLISLQLGEGSLLQVTSKQD